MTGTLRPVRARPISSAAAILLVAGAALGLTRALAATVPPAPGQVDPVQLPVSTSTTSTFTVPTTLPRDETSTEVERADETVPPSTLPPSTSPPAEAPPVTIPATHPTNASPARPTGDGSPTPTNPVTEPTEPPATLGSPGEDVDDDAQEENTGENGAGETDDESPASGNGGGGNGNGNANGNGNGSGSGNNGGGNGNGSGRGTSSDDNDSDDRGDD